MVFGYMVLEVVMVVLGVAVETNTDDKKNDINFACTMHTCESIKIQIKTGGGGG